MMMMMKGWTTTLALIAIAASPVGAQMSGMHHGTMHRDTTAHGAMDHGAMDHATMDHGMMQMCQGMMAGGEMAGHSMMQGGASGPAALLGAADELGLTPGQTSRLETLAETAKASRHEHMQAAMAAHGRASEALNGAAPDLGAYEQALEEAAAHMVRAHLADARAAVDGLAVLTPEQRAKVQGSGHTGHQH